MATGIRAFFGGRSRIIDPETGKKWRPVISGYNVMEDATPVDPSDSSGGVGQFTLNWQTRNRKIEKRLRKQTVDLSDRGKGTTTGIALTTTMAGGNTTLTVDSRLSLLTVVRTAQPFTGTLGDYLMYCLGLVGITSGIVIEPAVASVPITAPGWRGDVWVQLKKLAATKRFEISLVSDSIVVRGLRQRVAANRRNSDEGYTIDESGLAQSVEGYFYAPEHRTDSLAYPSGGWNEDVAIFQVDMGETVEHTVDIDASVSSVIQPTPVTYVARNDDNLSVYAVTGVDGIPIPPDQWTNAGGKLEVEIGEDTRTLIIRITGANIPRYAPFQISASSGPSDDYSSLRILGTGVFFDRQLYTFPLPPGPDVASQEVGTIVEMEFASTLAEFYDSMAWTLARYGAARQTINITTTGIHQRGDSGSYLYPKIEAVNAEFAGQTIADFNAAHAGRTIVEFNAEWLETVRGLFANQAFGNIAGARVFMDDAWWRVRSVPNHGPGGLSYTAEYDTTVGDFNAQWTGATIADFNVQWAGYTMRDFFVAPLERKLIPVLLPALDLLPSPQLYPGGD